MNSGLFVMHHAPMAKRKGEIVGSLTDSDLSPYGIEVAHRQAELVLRLLGSGALAGVDSLILSSPLRRALQTSEIIAEKCDMNVHTDTRLKAQNFGVLDGMTFDEILRNDVLKLNLWEYIPETMRDNHKAHGGESNKEMVRRVADFKDDVLSAHDVNNQPLVITHGTVIDSLIATIDSRRLDEIEGSNRVFEGRVIKFTDSTYNPIGEPLSAFSYIPGVTHRGTVPQQMAHIRNYLEACPREDERVHLEKLLDIINRNTNKT